MQLATVHAFVDTQLAPVLQHAHSDLGDVARVVQPRVGTTLVLQTQLLQHGAQLGLCAGDLGEEDSQLVSRSDGTGAASLQTVYWTYWSIHHVYLTYGPGLTLELSGLTL